MSDIQGILHNVSVMIHVIHEFEDTQFLTEDGSIYEVQGFKFVFNEYPYFVFRHQTEKEDEERLQDIFIQVTPKVTSLSQIFTDIMTSGSFAGAVVGIDEGESEYINEVLEGAEKVTTDVVH